MPRLDYDGKELQPGIPVDLFLETESNMQLRILCKLNTLNSDNFCTVEILDANMQPTGIELTVEDTDLEVRDNGNTSAVWPGTTV